MASPQIAPNKSLLVIGGNKPRLDSDTSTLDDVSSSRLKRDYKNDDDTNNLSTKKPRTNENNSIVPLNVKPLTIVEPVGPKLSRQFWKAGDDEKDVSGPSYCSNDAAVRVHPQFLHANATSHKWALGALAELLDNSLDEACNGATYVHVDSITNKRDEKSNILTVEDNGGGMNPHRFRECLSLGYSRKRNMANTVGQYGNGFKTSTMRLGADAIVFTRSRGTNGNKTTQSIGMLSYTFLYETRKCEAIVPTVDFELVDNKWDGIIHTSTDDWFDNLETIEKWSPFLSQEELLAQFDYLGEQGTRILIYNLWEDDEGKLELDFDTDPHDIQLSGVNRDEKNIEMAKANPNSRHFLTFRHSLRSYASILYLRLPKDFKIILRGKDVEHHNLMNDMMMAEDMIYRPVRSPECAPDLNMVATLKLGFVKDARNHIDIQGFNVYHKNRLIKPFWRVWNAAGSDGRGVIGILEANFIQPAHNKQGFERTTVLAKLEKRLIQYQKDYWSSRCHEIGYAPRRKQKNQETVVPETIRQQDHQRPQVPFKGTSFTPAPMSAPKPVPMPAPKSAPMPAPRSAPMPPPAPARSNYNAESSRRNQNPQDNTKQSVVDAKPVSVITNEKHGLRTSVNEPLGSVNLAAELNKVKEESAKQVAELERQKKQLEYQLKESQNKIQHLEKKQKEVSTYIQEDRTQRDVTEDLLRKRLRGASLAIDELTRKVNRLEEEKTYCKKNHGKKH